MENQTTVITEEKPEVIEPEKVTAPSAVIPVEEKPKEREIAYVIKDAYFPDLHVRKSDNAWWMDVRKVNKFIDALKSGLTIKACCLYTGINRGQFYYFMEFHPEFSDIIDALEDVQMIGFMNTINTQGKEDLPTARWYMDRKHPKFANKIKVEGDQPLKPTTINNVAIITGDVESAKIADAIKGLTESILKGREDEGVSDGGSGQAVEDSSKEQGA